MTTATKTKEKEKENEVTEEKYKVRTERSAKVVELSTEYAKHNDDYIYLIKDLRDYQSEIGVIFSKAQKMSKDVEIGESTDASFETLFEVIQLFEHASSRIFEMKKLAQRAIEERDVLRTIEKQLEEAMRCK